MGEKSNAPSIKVDTDAAKQAMILLDTFPLIKESARALGDFKSMYLDSTEYTGNHIPKKAINDVNSIIQVLKPVENDYDGKGGNNESGDFDASCALNEFKSEYLENLNKRIPQKAISGLDTIINSLNLINDRARIQTASVCPVPYLLPAYDKRSKLNQKMSNKTKKYHSHRSQCISE